MRVVDEREILEKIYNGSIAAEYFIKKRKTIKEIPGLHRIPLFTIKTLQENLAA